ncbi:MAG: hypothetical protein M1826_001958 [Phylliscum demangeonii]|nr:MAG: hypothetical protein M1826_001958 [Phylliscum demangeonii]
MDGGQAPRLLPHGVKRRAEDSPDGDQRLAKKLSFLSLRHLIDHAQQRPQYPTGPPPHRPLLPQEGPIEPEPMQIDDTRDRIYIANLDDELRENHAPDDQLVFLPDIDKQLAKIPRAVFSHPAATTSASTNNQLVLYNVPSSLSVPREQDSVRKAIIEARARAQEQQVAKGAQAVVVQDRTSPRLIPDDGGLAFPDSPPELEDPDAMDLG